MSKVGPMIEQMGTALQNADKQMEQADAEGRKAEALKQANVQEELRIKNKESEIKAYEAETAGRQRRPRRKLMPRTRGRRRSKRKPIGSRPKRACTKRTSNRPMPK
jgi:hypothetical protein